MNAVILCGGKGTRLKAISKGNPKILIPIKEKPFIYLFLDRLINNGFKKIFLLVGYKSKDIRDEIGDNYRNIPIEFIEDNQNLKSGTASAILNSIEKLPQHFLVQYGDTILDLNYKKFHRESTFLENSILMAIYNNKNNLDKNNVYFRNNELNYYNSESTKNNETIKNANYIDYGLLGIHKSFLEKYIDLLKRNESLKYFQEKLSYMNLIKPFIVNKRFYEIGTPDSYKDFERTYQKEYLNNLINSNEI